MSIVMWFSYILTDKLNNRRNGGINSRFSANSKTKG